MTESIVPNRINLGYSLENLKSHCSQNENNENIKKFSLNESNNHFKLKVDRKIQTLLPRLSSDNICHTE